ncbi:hypothetical protein ABT364_04935 [Massilia sp. SR12]
MSTFIFSVPASIETYQALGNFMYEHGIEQEMFELVDTVINAWMTDYVKAQNKQRASRLEGYQWKELFLPSGTALRTVYKRVSYLAHIEGSDLQYDGHSVSPGQFVNEVAQCHRNAWRTIWVRFPHEDDWKAAFALRNKTVQLETKRDRKRPKECV